MKAVKNQKSVFNMGGCDKIVELSTEEFFEKFKSYSEYFEQEETVLEDDENGIWIHVIIPNDTGTNNTLFIQSWDYGSSDPKHFVYFSSKCICIGSCDCALDPNQLLKFCKILGLT